MNDKVFGFFQERKDEKRINESKIILVTGGAGFIGSNFIRYIRTKYPLYKIINFDNLTYAGNLNNLSFIEENPNYIFVRGDVANQKDVKNVFEEYKPDFVIHFAAESHVDRSFINPEIFLQTNVIGTQQLLHFARTNTIEKFVYISTDEVYGSINKKKTCKEDSAIHPQNYYSVTKASADFLVQVAYRTYGQRVNIVRSCNNYGPFQFPEKLIPLMICNAMKNLELPVYGDGNYFRDWLHVEDHCRAIDAVLHKASSGEIFNVGAENEWKNIDLIEYLLEYLGKPKQLIKFVIDRPVHDFRYAINFNKIRKTLGWKPKIEFKQGLKETIDWYLSHQDWVQEITSGKYMKYYEQVYQNRTLLD